MVTKFILYAGPTSQLADQIDGYFEAAKTNCRQMLINPQAAVGWDLRFYQRRADNRWTCHGCWPLSKSPHHTVGKPPCLTVFTPAAEAAPPADLHLNFDRKS